MKLEFCPSLLREGYSTYSPDALCALFDGSPVSPYLDFDFEEDEGDTLGSDIGNLSISGVQEKYPAVVLDGKIVVAKQGDRSTHILKPVPLARITDRKQIPANEHLTMQIAQQVYCIPTAANGLCFTPSGQAVYITRRYDVLGDGSRLKQEELCSLLNRNEQTNGLDFKYNGSYEDIANAICKYVPQWQQALRVFYKLLLFDYIYANGDAHTKNFSLLFRGDNISLALAYDLINTEMHVHGSDLALEDGLSNNILWSDVYDRTGHLCQDDFRKFGDYIGLPGDFMQSAIEQFLTIPSSVETLICRSFLKDNSAKRKYLNIVNERHARFVRHDG